MRTEDFVTYSQAKALKELGFDWECNHWYHPDEPKKIYVGEYANHNKYDTPYSAPSIGQVRKWFSEVKNIVLYIDFEISEYLDHDYCIYIFDKNLVKYIEEGFSISSTYELAMYEGIDMVIKYLNKDD